MSLTTSRNTQSINATNSADFLVIRRGPAGIAIDAHQREDDWDSVTVGAFDLDGLRRTLDMLAATPDVSPQPDSPDLADGGVTCAAIEKEWDFTSGAGSVFPSPAKGTRYQRERDEARAMGALWKETARKLARESRNAHDWAERVETSIADVAARAEKAEQERDALIKIRDTLAEDLGRVTEERDEARRERDSWRSQVPLADWEKELVQATEQPRPLTAGDITDEAKQRAVDAWWEWKANGAVLVSNLIEMILTAALTEPPARPEGAKELDEPVGEALRAVGDLPSPEAIRAASDLLASWGVRVTGAES